MVNQSFQESNVNQSIDDNVLMKISTASESKDQSLAQSIGIFKEISVSDLNQEDQFQADSLPDVILIKEVKQAPVKKKSIKLKDCALSSDNKAKLKYYFDYLIPNWFKKFLFSVLYLTIVGYTCLTVVFVSRVLKPNDTKQFPNSCDHAQIQYFNASGGAGEISFCTVMNFDVCESYLSLWKFDSGENIYFKQNSSKFKTLVNNGDQKDLHDIESLNYKFYMQNEHP